MVEEQEQNWANELRGERLSALNNPSENDPLEEGGEGELGEEESIKKESAEEQVEKVEGLESERKARRVLFSKRRLAVLAQRAAAKAVQMAGRAQQIISLGLRQGGWTLFSFGSGLGLTLIGLIFGVPLIILGGILFVTGFLAMVTARLSITAGRLLEMKATAEAKKLTKETKEEGGSLGSLPEETVGKVREVTRFASLIFMPFIDFGCIVLGLLSGFFFLIIIIVVLGSAML